MNNVCLIGRLTRDPETKSTNSTGEVYVRFSLAVDNGKNTDGTRKTAFIDCAAFGKTAQTVLNYTSKGVRVGVTGSLDTFDYTAQDGTKRRGTSVNVFQLTFADSKRDAPAPAPSSPVGVCAQTTMTEVEDDDLPF